MDERTYSHLLESQLEGRNTCIESVRSMLAAADAGDDRDIRLLHAALGLSTEAGEFEDAIKKRVVYGKPLDYVNLIEELGDAIWYIQLACIALGVDFDHLRAVNMAKLKKRYPNKFTAHDAINRDLDGERRVLEEGTNTGN